MPRRHLLRRRMRSSKRNATWTSTAKTSRSRTTWSRGHRSGQKTRAHPRVRPLSVQRRLDVPAMSVLVVLMALWSGVQQPTGSSLRLDRVEIAGAKRYSSADVLRISGLQQGQVLTEDDVRRAGGRMVETGFFKSVRYRYEPLDGVVRVTLEIEEEIWSVP